MRAKLNTFSQVPSLLHGSDTLTAVTLAINESRGVRVARCIPSSTRQKPSMFTHGGAALSQCAESAWWWWYAFSFGDPIDCSRNFTVHGQCDMEDSLQF